MFVRSERNPIITAPDLGFGANAVFNPGATITPDGATVLLLRVEDRCGLSAIHVARSQDGETDWQIERTPLLRAQPDHLACEWGFEDPRVSFVPELDRYVITCTAYGQPGPCVYLATTRGFETIDYEGVALTPEDKNAAVIPRRLGGHWWMLHRPVVMVTGAADIWISRSSDLVSWQDPEPVMVRRSAGWWDASRIGIGPPPIEMSEGWLQLYHGVRNSPGGPIYRMGAALLDLEHPWRVVRRLPEWLLSPSEPYERTGDVGNVVFPCGAVRVGDELRVYYGAADTTVCMARCSISELVAALFDHGEREQRDIAGRLLGQ